MAPTGSWHPRKVQQHMYITVCFCFSFLCNTTQGRAMAAGPQSSFPGRRILVVPSMDRFVHMYKPNRQSVGYLTLSV